MKVISITSAIIAFVAAINSSTARPIPFSETERDPQTVQLERRGDGKLLEIHKIPYLQAQNLNKRPRASLSGSESERGETGVEVDLMG